MIRVHCFGNQFFCCTTNNIEYKFILPLKSTIHYLLRHTQIYHFKPLLYLLKFLTLFTNIKVEKLN